MKAKEASHFILTPYVLDESQDFWVLVGNKTQNNTILSPGKILDKIIVINSGEFFLLTLLFTC